jgi:hypothetical protein
MCSKFAEERRGTPTPFYDFSKALLVVITYWTRIDLDAVQCRELYNGFSEISGSSSKVVLAFN